MQTDCGAGRRQLLILRLPCFYTELQCPSSKLPGSFDMNLPPFPPSIHLAAPLATKKNGLLWYTSS